MGFTKRSSNCPVPPRVRSSCDSVSSGSSSSFRETNLWDIPGTNRIRLLFYTKMRSTVALDPKDVDLFQFTGPPSPITPPPPLPSRKSNSDYIQTSAVSDHVLEISSQVFLPLDISIATDLDDNVSSLSSPLMTEVSDTEIHHSRSKRSSRPLRSFPVSSSRSRSRRASRRHRQPSTIIALTDEGGDMPESPRPLSCISAYTFVDDHLRELNFSYMDGSENTQINTKRDSVILPATALDHLLQQTIPAPPQPRKLRPLPIPATPPSSPSPLQTGFRRSLRPLPPLPSTTP